MIQKAIQLVGVDETIDHACRHAQGSREGRVEKGVALAFGLTRLEHVDGGEHVDRFLLYVLLDPRHQGGDLIFPARVAPGRFARQAPNLRMPARYRQGRSKIALPIAGPASVRGRNVVSWIATHPTKHLAALTLAHLQSVGRNIQQPVESLQADSQERYRARVLDSLRARYPGEVQQNLVLVESGDGEISLGPRLALETRDQDPACGDFEQRTSLVVEPRVHAVAE